MADVPHFRITAPAGAINFDSVRTAVNVPADFPADVLAEAEQAAAQRFTANDSYQDATDIPLVTLDPPGSMDLDQAVHIAAKDDGFLVHYAIADLAAFVRPGGAIDTEARHRGQTMYLPDGNVPLHPRNLSEGATSLLPDRLRPAALWTIELDADGNETAVHLTRAIVKSVARLDYSSCETDQATGRLHPSIRLLPAVGELRLARGIARGAINLDLPERQIVPDGKTWKLRIREVADIERYNAEISLLTGICAARMMLDHRIGLLRTLPPPPEAALAAIEKQAQAAQIRWPRGTSLSQVLAGVDPKKPRHLAFLEDAVRLLRGAGYTAFDGQLPEHPGHAGVGAAYAHVTAPLRRLGDRFATEICLALSAGQPVPNWATADLPDIAEATEGSYRRAGEVERACLDLVQMVLLRPLIGRTITGIVVQTDRKRHTATILADHEQARLTCHSSDAVEGSAVTVRIDAIAPEACQISATIVTAPHPETSQT